MNKNGTVFKSSGVEWVGDVPEHWQVCKLKRLSPVKRGASPRPIDDPKFFDDDGEFSWVRISDVTASRKYLTQTTQKLSTLGSSLSVKLDPETFFVSIAASVGKPIITKIKCCIHDGFVYFPYLQINPDFLYYLFDGGQLFQGLGKLGTQLNLNTETIGSIHIPLPPNDEIQLIVDYLDRETTQIDNLIAAKEQMLTLLEEKREALISHAVTRGLDPNVAFKQSGLDWLGDIPQHWSIERAKGLFREVDNRTTSGEEELLSLRMHVGLVPHHDVSDKILEPKDVIGFKKVETGQLVINRMRASMGLIAISPQNGLVSPDYAVFDIVKLIHIPYFLALFNTSLVGALFRSSSKGLGTGSSGFLRLYSESFLSIHFPVPSLDEQKEITNFLDQEQQRTGELEKALTDSISLLKERRSALITAAVTGQITLEEMKK